MISELQAAVLGVVQGLTEFLPVSSSAHLTLVPWLLGWQDPGLAFDVALHLGTLLALLTYYWREWMELLLSLVGGAPDKRRLLILLIVASIPGAIFGLLLEKQAESTFRSPLLIAITLGAMGIVLWIVDLRAPRKRSISEITLGGALLIGLSQAFAIIPGFSRSGITITTARAIGVKREDAANFSFLMAAPIIGGAGVVKARELLHGPHHGVGIGFLFSAVFGLIAITALIRLVRTRSYVPFAWYRIAVAIFVIAVYLHRA